MPSDVNLVSVHLRRDHADMRESRLEQQSAGQQTGTSMPELNRTTTTPQLSYSEVFEIELNERGTLRIVITGEDAEIELALSHEDARTFVDAEHAANYCDHNDPEERYWQGVEDGHDDALNKYSSATAVLEDWHNQNHSGPAVFCHLEPCRDIRVVGDDLS
jgi:hypothetical protein